MAQATTDTKTDPQSRLADLATDRIALDRREMVLLGTFGTAEKPGALMRLPSGKVRKLVPGDRIAGARVQTIGAGALVLERGGKTRFLYMPGEARKVPGTSAR